MKHSRLFSICMSVIALISFTALAGKTMASGHSFFGDTPSTHHDSHHVHHVGAEEETEEEAAARTLAEKYEGTLWHRVKGKNKAQAMRICQEMLDEMAGHVDEVEEKVFHEEAALGALISKKALAGRIRALTEKKIRYDIKFFEQQVAFYKDVLGHDDTPEDVRRLVGDHLLKVAEMVTHLMKKRLEHGKPHGGMHSSAKGGSHSFFGGTAARAA